LRIRAILAVTHPREGTTMADEQIRFDDGAAYEDFMGRWSLVAGNAFLDWLSPAPGLRWVDVGCGNGAFTELLVRRCQAADVQGIDPSEEQLAFARERLAGAPASFAVGDAMALPWADGRFDAAVMALVIFFVPEPARGIAEMVRVIRPHGTFFVRDLLRPENDEQVRHFVNTYAAGANAHQQAMFDASLRAALTLEEVRALVVPLGFAEDTVLQTSDRHWTWMATRSSL